MKRDPLESTAGVPGGDSDFELSPSVFAQLGDLLKQPPFAASTLSGQGDGPRALGEPAGAGGAARHARYVIGPMLGRGGMGEVYECQDADLGRTVAIKMLAHSAAGNAEIERRFIEEARIGGQLEHPGIASVHDLGFASDHRPFFTMKLVRGHTLADLLDPDHDPAPERRRLLTIFEQICQTVAYAHTRRVIHRDLKPANIMVGAFGEVQVMDWGLAKVLSGAVQEAGDSSGATPSAPPPAATPAAAAGDISESADRSRSLAGSVMGTPPYMSPEQARGQIDLIDERSDVFSLGAILCEILTGLPPYHGDRRSVILAASSGLLADAYSRLDACGADRQLIAIAKGCLQSERPRRPSSAVLVAAEISDYLAAVEERARAAQVRAAEALVQAAGERRARRLTLALATTILVATIGGGGSYLWFSAARRSLANAAAQEALAEASQRHGEAQAAGLEGVARWPAAERAAQQALELATADVTPSLRQSAVELSARVSRGADLARRNHALVARLEALRLEHLDSIAWSSREPEHRAAFREYGIDLATADDGSLLARLRASGIPDTLVLALDLWALAAKRTPAVDTTDWRRLAGLAQQLDADPWRRQVREAVLAEDAAALEALAAPEHIAAASSWSLDALAWSLYDLGLRDQALAVYRAGEALHPEDLWLQHNLAMLLTTAAKPLAPEAVRHYTAALALRPSNAHLWLDLGNTFLMLGALPQAVSAFERSVALDPASPHALNNLGICARRMRNLPRAIQLYRDALRVDPGYTEASSNLGIALRESGDIEGALAVYRDAIGKRSDKASLYFNYAVALEASGDFAATIAAYRDAIRCDPKFVPPYCNLGELLTRQGRPDEAIAQLLEAVRQGPDQAITHFALASFYIDQGRMVEAEPELRRTIELVPEHPALCKLGGLLFDAGRFRESLVFLERCKEAGGKTRGLTAGAAELVAACEPLAALERRLEQIDRGEGKAVGHEENAQIAMLCERQQRYARAVEFARAAFAADRTFADRERGHRYNAACAAVLAGLGQGQGAPESGAERAALREQAHAWLTEELDSIERQLAGQASERQPTLEFLARWQADPDLAGVREAAEQEQLPEGERTAWQALWGRVQVLATR